MITERVSYEQLLGISGCLALALLAHVTTLPFWVPVIVVACGLIRLWSARRGGGAPPRTLLFILAALAIPLLFLRFHTFNGLVAGTALLSVAAGLKLLETKTRRDIYIITLIIYFVSLAALLQGDSFWLLAYLIGVCWLTTATLLRVTSSGPAPGWRRSLRYGGRVLAQALPLALVFWLLFPRFAGPLWHIPNDSQAAASGLSDTMSPGDINHLALSDEVAFRVRFAGAAPPAAERYFRGPVLDGFDGHRWKRATSGLPGAPALQPLGIAYRYTVMMEPHQHRWIFMLDWPAAFDLPRALLTNDYTLMQPDPLSRAVDVTGTSYTHVQFSQPLSKNERWRDLQQPRDRNPRTQQLAQELRSAHPGDMELVDAVLGMFRQQPFFYTLSPPMLSDNSVDDFLFNTKRGFCEHYASAFAALMRAAGIPARVVTGYQGGTLNPYGNYWIFRQSDAHAWTEIWIDGGWKRIDPTAAIAPERVERGLADTASADDPLVSRWQSRIAWFAGARLRLDLLREIWRERILDFDQDSQRRLLEMLHVPEPDGQKLVMLLTVGMALVLGWLTWQVRRELSPESRDVAARTYARLCSKLAAAGLPRRMHEGAEDYALRVASRRPDLAATVTALCRHYSSLRYAQPSARITLGQFQAGVRAFRPKTRPKLAP
jgi:transglutaminase-like putative cysteine protease